VDDLLQGLMALMASDRDVTGPINLGNPGEYTMKELANLVLELTKSKSELVYEALPADDPVRRCPDIGRAEKQLGWAPSIALREGLGRTISYFDDLLRGAKA
jgi:UDP-glucuronate decarboxylase